MGKAVGAWLAGILAAIIGGYALYVLTRSPSTTTVEGMAYSASAAVPKAMVSLTLSGNGANSGPYHNVTDENGSYRFEFTGLSASAGATLRVVANGFHESSPVSLSRPLGPDIHEDFALIPLVAPHNPAGHATLVEHKPNYVRKAAEQATLIRVKP